MKYGEFLDQLIFNFSGSMSFLLPKAILSGSHRGIFAEILVEL
jgi:hypothetical protein